jgi:hypothetical protein
MKLCHGHDQDQIDFVHYVEVDPVGAGGEYLVDFLAEFGEVR